MNYIMIFPLILSYRSSLKEKSLKFEPDIECGSVSASVSDWELAIEILL